MKGYRLWLAGMAASILLVPLAAVADGDKSFSANLESGAAALTSTDDIKKVNEYSSLRTKNGVNPYGKVDLSVHQRGIVFDGDFRYLDSRDQDHSASLDLMRVFKTDFSYSVLNHWLDHDRMQYLDAAIPAAPSAFSGAATPITLSNSAGLTQTVNLFTSNSTTNTLNPNFVPAFLVKNKVTGATYVTNTAPLVGYGNAAYSFQQIGRASVYGEDLTPSAVFGVKRTEWSSKSDLTIPQLPNVTFHFGYRNEDRNGLKQSIGMSKCTSCHVTGQSKVINENTRDISAGATGRFGLLTIDYTYLNRQFRENAPPPTRYYDPALSPGAAAPATYNTGGYAFFDNRLLYDYRDGLLRYDETPDSKKESHVVKAKVDLPGAASLMGSYVRATVDSGKTGEAGIFSFNGSNGVTLHTTYDAYGGRLTSTFGKDLTVTLRGRSERISNDDVTIAFSTIANATGTQPPNNFVPDPNSLLATRYSALSRDTITAGLDAVYRVALRTTLRLGYEYQMLDRHDGQLGTTTSHKVSAGLMTRPGSTVSARAAIDYQVIDNPYQNVNAALTNFTTNTLGSTVGNGATYGVSLYDQRTANLTNQPDKVVNGKLSATWTPSARYAITGMYTLKAEENQLNKSSWSQTTHGPGLSFWYAPTNVVSMTVSYNYLNQKSGTAYCQGWYDG